MSDRLFKGKPKRILAFCGTKQSGKNAAANFVGATLLYSYYCIDSYQLTHDGILLNGKPQNINDVAPNFLKVYHWADELKRVCSSIFNIDIRLMYGTDKDKETPTDLLWQNMPGVTTNKKLFADVTRHINKKGDLLGLEYKDPNFQIIYHEPGNMSVRDILQYFGTDICRTMYEPCWTSALFNTIKSEAPMVALIADTRFDNEAEAVKSWGGLCIKLNRVIKTDSHKSENGFINFNSWDAIVENQKTNTIPEFCEILYKTLRPIGAFEELI